MEQTIMRIGVKAVIKGVPTPHNHCFFLFPDWFDGVTDREKLAKTPSNTQKHDGDTVFVGVTDREKLAKTPTRHPFCLNDTNPVGVKMATTG